MIYTCVKCSNSNPCTISNHRFLQNSRLHPCVEERGVIQTLNNSWHSGLPRDLLLGHNETAHAGSSGPQGTLLHVRLRVAAVCSVLWGCEHWLVADVALGWAGWKQWVPHEAYLPTMLRMPVLGLQLLTAHIVPALRGASWDAGKGGCAVRGQVLVDPPGFAEVRGTLDQHPGRQRGLDGESRGWGKDAVTHLGSTDSRRNPFLSPPRERPPFHASPLPSQQSLLMPP